MAGNFTDDLANDLLNLVFGGVALPLAASFEIALLTVAPSDDGTGETEVSTGVWTNYARAVVTRNQTNFPAAANRAITNGAAINFGTADITGTPPEIVAAAVLDATSDRMEAFGILSTAKTINDEDPVDFAVGDFDWQINPSA